MEALFRPLCIPQLLQQGLNRGVLFRSLPLRVFFRHMKQRTENLVYCARMRPERSHKDGKRVLEIRSNPFIHAIQAKTACQGSHFLICTR